MKSDRNSRSQSICLTFLLKKNLVYFENCHYIQCILKVAFNTIEKPFKHNEYDWKILSYDHMKCCVVLLRISRYIHLLGIKHHSINQTVYLMYTGCLRDRNHMVNLQLPMLSVPITTNVVSSNPAQAIQHCMINFVSDLRQVCGFLRAFQFPPPIKLTATI